MHLGKKAEESNQERKTFMGKVLLVGMGSMHVRFVLEEAERFPGIEWVWEDGESSCWDEENQRAEETREILRARGVRRFDEERDGEALLGILVLTGDGSRRVEEYRRWSRQGVPIYLDKPVTVDRQQYQTLKRMESEGGVPWVSGSCWRFFRGWNQLLKDYGQEMEEITIEGPWYERPGRAGWCWYGVHGVELLCHALGSRLERIQVTREQSMRRLEIETGDGRRGVFLGDLREGKELYARVLCNGEEHHQKLNEAIIPLYGKLLEGILTFFTQGRKWYAEEELENVVRVLDAGWKSEQGSKWIKLD